MQLLPLRIPELSTSMGKLTSGTSSRVSWVPLDEIRTRLVTRVFESAGEARRLAANNERAAALAALGSANWKQAWDEAVSTTAELLFKRVSEHLDAEARAVGMGTRRRARIMLDSNQRRAMAARLGTAGTNLIRAFDTLERSAGGALGATALERDQVESWQQQLKYTARQLEAAWLSLEQTVLSEQETWQAVADDVARWRRPLWPVAVGGVVALVCAVWLGAVLSGLLRAPAWFEALWRGLGLP